MFLDELLIKSYNNIVKFRSLLVGISNMITLKKTKLK